MICNFFFRFDNFANFEINLLYSILVNLLSLRRNHHNSIRNLHQIKSSCLYDECFFLDRFKVGSVPGKRSKEALAVFIL